MDLTQIVLLSVSIVLAIFLVAVGLQAFFVLKSLRRTLSSLDKLLNEADDLVGQVKKPLESVRNVLKPSLGIALGAFITYLITKKKGQNIKNLLAKEGHRLVDELAAKAPSALENQNANKDAVDQIHQHIDQIQKKGRRFFFRRHAPES